MLRFVVSMAILLTIAPQAMAQAIEPGKEGVLADLLAPTPGKRLCFARSYSKDHLEAHPKQKVTDVQFHLSYYRHQPDEFYSKGQRNYYFRMMAKLRGSSKTYTAMGECSASGANIFCGVECDGGGVNLRSRPQGRLLVFFANENSEIRMTEGCDEADEGNYIELKPGDDDKEFLLNPVNAGACPAYERW